MDATTSEYRAERLAVNENTFPWPLRSYPGKRMLDVVVSLGLLLLSAPLFPLIALAIKLSSPGPVLFRGRRMGQGAREFALLKFRSMTVGAGGAAITAQHDARVTRVGRVIRKLKLDELPQLVNVLRGDLAIVGPRPEDAGIVRELYTREQLRVLSAPAGLTGPLQVRVFPDLSSAVPEEVDPTKYYHTVQLPERLAEDLEYVDRMSLGLDLKVIAQTAYCILVKTWL
jgi:lipopolysaccharide/colanic/teichoic acid biosynthesis glycosyltransferase